MGNLGFGELLLILIVILLVFGTSKVPQLGDALGRGIRNFRKAVKEDEPRSDAALPPASAARDAPPAEKK